MEMAGSSSALDVSTPTYDKKFMTASNVNVSNFVSVKLSGRVNYKIWKAQMLCLIKSQALLHVVDSRCPYPGDKAAHMNEQYEELVKGWIFGSLNEKVLNDFVEMGTVQEVWMKLESLFNLPVSNTEGDSSNAPDVSALDHVLAPVVYAMREDLKYIQALNVDVSNFVSEKLEGKRNYYTWKKEMLHLIESHELLHIIHAEARMPWNEADPMTKKYDSLVRGWILSTIIDKERDKYRLYRSVQFMWRFLESAFTYQPVTSDSDSDIEDVLSKREEDMKLIQLKLNVNLSNFVSVKLSDTSNYNIWRTQMLFLLESQSLLHIIIDGDFEKNVEYGKVVKACIFCTIKEELHYLLEELWEEQVDILPKDILAEDYVRVKKLWEKLKAFFEWGYSRPEHVVSASTQDLNYKHALSVNVSNFVSVKLSGRTNYGIWKAQMLFLIKSQKLLHIIDNNGFYELDKYDHLIKGWIFSTMSEQFLSTYNLKYIHDDSAKITWKRLKFTVDREDPREVKFGIEFHRSTELDNTNKKRWYKATTEGWWRKAKSILKISKNAATTNDNTLRHVAVETESSRIESVKHKLLDIRPLYKLSIDLAEELIKQKRFEYLDGKDILMAMTITFPTDLGFVETFIYPSFHNVRQKIAMRISMLFHSETCVANILQVVNTCNNRCNNLLVKNSMILLVLTSTLYPMYQLVCLLILMLRLPFSMMYLLLWKVLVVFARPIQNIEKKRKEYKKAKNILRMVCKKMGPSCPTDYRDSLFEAVRLDIHEVVDEIIFTTPATIDCKDEDGYNIIQSSILNRAEKVYNLIYHIIERTKSHREMNDSFENNLGHLAGRLAPSFVLSRTTGAALQLQHELLWFEEVKKLVLPLQLTKKNLHKETPAMVFTREHHDLLRQGEIWMKTTAESCSITAALIVTVVFAAAITVPGGNNQESGIPVFKKEIAFTIFALSNAFSLFTGATALLLFLSILTARSSEKDFLVSLPRRLIFGLVTLFLSTIALMVSFCAILYLVFSNQRLWMLAPICAFACLPISVIVTIKLPLLVDLIQSTYSPIFGKQRYSETCKVNRKNTIFTK